MILLYFFSLRATKDASVNLFMVLLNEREKEYTNEIKFNLILSLFLFLLLFCWTRYGGKRLVSSARLFFLYIICYTVPVRDPLSSERSWFLPCILLWRKENGTVEMSIVFFNFVDFGLLPFPWWRSGFLSLSHHLSHLLMGFLPWFCSGDAGFGSDGKEK